MEKGGLTIRCYGDRDECRYYQDGWCERFSKMCEDVHVDMIKEDGDE